MTGVRIRIEGNTQAAQKGLVLLAKAGADLRPAFEDIGAALVRSTRQRFEDQVGPDGQGWQPASPGHLLFKQKKGYQMKTLSMRGRLKASIVAKAGATQLVVGTSVVYGAIHQLGGSIKIKGRIGSLRLRTDAKGNLLSQAQLGIGPKRMRNADQMKVFAKKSHKRFVELVFAQGAHEVTMPARPFLGMSLRDQDETLAITREHLQRALENLKRP